MKKLISSIALACLMPMAVFADAKVGAAAPDFTVSDVSGKSHKLSDFKGKNVVLEWYNKDCPYVRKHYDAGNMQKLQKAYKDQGVVWLTVISSAKGKQGFQENKDAETNMNKEGFQGTALLIDADGKVGKAYGAKTTPHMYLINKEGLLAYNGAIDDNDSSNPASIPKAKNYIAAAVDSTLKGEKVAVTSSKPYGCSVKY